MRRVESEYLELRLVIAEDLRAKKLLDELDFDVESSVSLDSELASDEICTDIDDDEVSSHYEDCAVPEHMKIPREIIDIICPGGLTFGAASFRQVTDEKVLSEEVLAVDKALSIMSDYGKLVFKP